MKTAKTLLTAALVALALVATTASATGYRGYYRGGGYGHWHGHSHYYYPRFSVGIWGPGYWGWPGYWGPGWGGYYSGYYPSYPAVVYSEPRVYVERDEGAAAPSGSGQWWYWCASAKQYYPYVSTCSEGWQRVPPQPVR
jgi:hypothetical protein